MILSKHEVGKDHSFRDDPPRHIYQNEERSISFLESFGNIMKSVWPVIREQAKKPRKREGSSSAAIIMGSMKVEYPDDINKMVSESKSRSQSIVAVGESIDVKSLLSCNGMVNYLVRNNGDRVDLTEETFNGKYILVCCFHVPIFRENPTSLFAQALVSTCSDLYSVRDDFEMVVVAKMNMLADLEPVYDHFLSGFPSSCLVVPFSDSKRRDFICKYLDFGRGYIECLLVDASGSILHHRNPNFALTFGAEAFPFSKECLLKVFEEDNPLWTTPSMSTLEGLLKCKSFDVVHRINPAAGQEKVSISELNKTLVALYLCVEGNRNFICTLHKVYQECRTRQLKFEIVVVYLPVRDCLDPVVHQMNIDSLLQEENICWWRLPFNNCVSRRLMRISYSYNEDSLIIVGPCDEFVDHYGGDIMRSYGVDGYPFTREGLVQRELNRLRALTFESLLVCGSQGYVLRGNDRMTVAELRGRNVLLYLGCFDFDKDELYSEVLTWYHEIKAKDPDFEVVFVHLNGSNTTEVEENSVLPAMPWFVCPFDPHHSASMVKKIFPNVSPYDTLVELGKDGQVCSFEAQELLRVYGADAFPFDDNLRAEVILRLDNIHEFMSNME